MKKIYSILGLCALFALPTFAQEEDVTSYIANPGFDEDVTWTANGETKTIVDKSVNISSRSQVWRAEDGSTYAHAITKEEGNGTYSRSDDHAWNGFFGQIKGWTAESANQEKPEWVYFGSVSYGMGPTAIPIADNGTTYLEVPEKPAEDAGEDNKAALYLRAGWGAQAIYKQEVKLPCAVYRLEYWIYNTNYEGSKNNTNVQNLCKVTCRKDTWEDTEGFNCQEWTKHTIEFTPTASFEMQFGFKSSGGSGSNPYILLDGIKLYKIGDADPAELLLTDIMDIVEQINSTVEDNLSDFGAVSDEIADKLAEFEDVAYSGEAEAMEVALAEIKAYQEKVNEFVATAQSYIATVDEASEFLDSEKTYPGADALSAAIDKAGETIETGTMAQVAEGLVTLQKAMKDYILSQETPADFTLLIDQPNFVEQGAWYKGANTSGDQRIKADAVDNEGNTISCWNAWTNNLTSSNSVSIQQDIADLPNGYYTVTGDLCTQDGLITNQHIYASSTVGTAVSPAMTVTGWDPQVWETLTTEQVLVVDGKLTIGAIGNGVEETGSTKGWFCLTNVKLTYVAPATDAEIAAAVEATIAAAKEYAAGMHFDGDKATFLEVVNATKTTEDLAALKAAKTVAEASETEYSNIMNGSYKDLKDRMNGEAEGVTYSANAKKITKVVLDAMDAYIASTGATAEAAQALTSVQRLYRDTVNPTLADAEAKAEEISNATGKAALQSTIESFVANLSTYTKDEEYINEQVAMLKEAINIAIKSDIQYGDNTDVTAYITNPNVDDESGWTFVKAVGNTNTASGQSYDNSSSRYIDSWSSGGTRHTGYQVLNVPNGKYVVSNIMRTSGTGAYLFASDKAPVTSEAGAVSLDATATNVLAEAVAKATSNEYVGAETEEASTVYTDSYGEIWTAAAKNVIAALGITESPVDAEGSRIYDFAVEKNQGATECPAGVDATDWAILGANSGKGRGWFNNSLEIEVKDHVLVIGATCDYVFVNNDAEKAFSGQWFSADNFKLTLVKAGDNTGWNPATTVESVETSTQPTAVYSISGTRVNGLQKGINIVKMSNGVVKKVLVK